MFILILTLGMLRKLRKTWYYKGLNKGYELGLQARKLQQVEVPNKTFTEEVDEILNRENF